MRRGRALLAAALSVAVLAATTRAEDAPPATGSVTPAGLEAFLRAAGYTPSDEAKTGLAVYSKRRAEELYKKETLYVRAKVSDDVRGRHVILSARIQVDQAIERARLIEMLGWNAGESGVAFSLASIEGKDALYLLRFVDNRALIPTALGLEIEEFFDVLRKTADLWDLSRPWSGSAKPGAPVDVR